MKTTIYTCLFLTALFLQILAFLDAFPLLISSPILFITIFILLTRITKRNHFKGFFRAVK